MVIRARRTTNGCFRIGRVGADNPGGQFQPAQILPQAFQARLVRIDGGPYYAPNTSTDVLQHYLWHIAGKGWMVHRYLIPLHIG